MTKIPKDCSKCNDLVTEMVITDLQRIKQLEAENMELRKKLQTAVKTCKQVKDDPAGIDWNFVNMVIQWGERNGHV